MNKRLTGLILTAALLLPINANAFFFDSMIEGMTEVATSMVDGATSTTNNAIDAGEATAQGMFDTMEVMADNIGLMADRILTMADKIGEMADRIVKTEEMILGLQNNQCSTTTATTAAVAATEAPSVMLSVYRDTIWSNETPSLNVSGSNDGYILYVSSSIFNTDSTSVIIKNSNDLYKFWPLLKNAANNNNKIYLAAKAINGSSLSALSNSVEITLY
jgi:hypothetical protein